MKFESSVFREAILIAAALATTTAMSEVPGDWTRSDPHSAIYLPTTNSVDDRTNQQVVGIVTQAGSYLVTWTMAGTEGDTSQRIAISRSTDSGATWSAPQIIDEDSPTYPGAASYSWLFQVPATGRIYCFYLKNDPSVVTVRRDITGWLKWQYSDDDGVTWQRATARFDMGRGDWTSSDPNVPTSFIGIYAPHITSWGDVLFSFARYGLYEDGNQNYSNWMTEVYFLRIDNILTETDPEALTFTVLPDSPQGLRIQRDNGLYWGNEPSWIELSDGRLLTAIRTRNDAVYYALSSDRGLTWTPPAPLRYADGGEIVLNPNAPCPLVKLNDGRLVLMFYNAVQSATFGPRNPVWISVGEEDLASPQPIRLQPPRLFMEVDGTPPLAEAPEQIASYSTFAEHAGELLLFYNDCKHWVLFKHAPEGILSLETGDLVLADINADGTSQTATPAHFEAATGLAGGTFSGAPVIAFPNSDPGGGAFSQTVHNITIQVSDITNDADNWFGGGSDNNLLDDGLYHRDTGADPTALITLSGSGLGLAANRRYELYLFAGRSQGHETTFTFDVNDPQAPSGGMVIHTDPPAVGGDNALGTVLFMFDTGTNAPASLVIQWDGSRDIDGNQDAVFSGFALRDIGAAGSDTTAPKISRLSPANSATGVSVDTDLVATFNEPIVTNTTGSIVISNRSDHSTITIPIGDASQVTVNANRLTIGPTNDLAASTPYAVLIDTNALRDAAGNFFDGITNAATWAFETGASGDWRDLQNGWQTPDENYADQPCFVVLEDGKWLMTLTTGPGNEGQDGQHVVSCTSSNQGQTWSSLVDIEATGFALPAPYTGVLSSWVAPYLSGYRAPAASYNRVYAIYTWGDPYNTTPPVSRRDGHGFYAFRYSDDGGSTWSSSRHIIPYTNTDKDNSNFFSGAYPATWNTDKPLRFNGKMFFSFTKMSTTFQTTSQMNGEGYIYRCDNIDTEGDPTALDWKMLPGTVNPDHSVDTAAKGIRELSWGEQQEEFDLEQLASGALLVTCRTTLGWLGEALSTDEGQTWTEPVKRRYHLDGRIVRHPRANCKVWKLNSGKYLMWHHNNGGTSWDHRNPCWVSIGTEAGNAISWGEPEILLYHRDKTKRISYPDMMEVGGTMYVSKTEKGVSTIHPIDAGFLSILETQPSRSTKTTSGLQLEQTGTVSGTFTMPALPDLGGYDPKGFTIETRFQTGDLNVGQTVFDTSVGGKGVRMTVNTVGAVDFEMSDGTRSITWRSDTGTVVAGQPTHISVHVDAAAKTITMVANGRVCDGTNHNTGNGDRTLGWTHFDAAFGDVNGGDIAVGAGLNGTVDLLRIYDRALMHTEAIANWRNASGISGPAVSAGIVSSVARGELAQLVTFDASHSYVSELTTPVYTWDFGDGSSTVEGAATNHSFATAGTYTVTMTISEVGTPSLQGHPVARLDFDVGQVPADAVTVAYWEFDSHSSSPGLTDSVGSYDLAVAGGAGFSANAAAAANPVPNPDTTPGFTGDPTANPDAGVANASLSAPGGTGQNYLNVPTDPGTVFNLSGKSFTFEGWFQHSASVAPDGFGHIIGGTRNAGDFGGYLVKMEANGSLKATFHENNDVAGGPVTFDVTTSGTDYRNDTEFHHFALVWQDGAGDNGTGFVRIYIDGVLEASGSAPSDFSAAEADAGDQAFIIGGRNAASENTWDGRFDEFRFSSAALTPSEFLSTPPAPPAVLRHNWTFDADLTDAIGGKDATAFGDAHVQTDASKIGTGAALFDGSGDYMTAGTTNDFVVGTGVMSVSFWFKGTYQASDRMLATGATDNSQAGWAVFQTAAAFAPAMGDGSSPRIIGATPADTPYDGAWHLAVLVFDASLHTVIGYLDAVPGTPATGTVGSIANSFPLYFGTRAGAGSLYTDGLLDDVAIWDGALNQADVDRLWNNGDGRAAAVPPTTGTLLIIK